MKTLRIFLRYLARNRGILAYLTLLVFELTVIRHLSDLNPETQNWVPKAQQLIHLQIPDDNFYGPGGALMMVPFAFTSGTAYFANYFYLVLGSFAYWNISSSIQNLRLKIFSLIALPANFYLIWLINSSQDTVFEFALLMWGIFFLIKKSWLRFAFVTFLLCETRAGYWVFFLGVSFLFFIVERKRTKRYSWTKLISVLLLFLSSFFNFVNYSSPTPALESGVTAYFSYTKYHYLALPKMDMDVFLSGPKGAFSKQYGPMIPIGSSPAERNHIYQKAAFESALINKKETVLGWMQKFDSYVFDVQKIPHLPGAYVFDQENKTIVIVDERLSWQFVLGNLAFEIYRSILLLGALSSIGLLCAFRILKLGNVKRDSRFLLLATPFIFGFFPGLLMYTETRFKIVSELLLVPLVAEIWSQTLSFRIKKINA